MKSVSMEFFRLAAFFFTNSAPGTNSKRRLGHYVFREPRKLHFFLSPPPSSRGKSRHLAPSRSTWHGTTCYLCLPKEWKKQKKRMEEKRKGWLTLAGAPGRHLAHEVLGLEAAPRGPLVLLARVEDDAGHAEAAPPGLCRLLGRAKVSVLDLLPGDAPVPVSRLPVVDAADPALELPCGWKSARNG